jgi:hypothetical protein
MQGASQFVYVYARDSQLTGASRTAEELRAELDEAGDGPGRPNWRHLAQAHLAVHLDALGVLRD